MLVLYETSAGYSLFKVTDKKKYSTIDASDIYEQMFVSSQMAQDNISLVHFQPFIDTADAVQNVLSTCYEGQVTDTLQSFLTKRIKKFLKKSDTKKGSSGSTSEMLAVADKNLAVNIKSSTANTDLFKVVHDDKTNELFRGIRCYLNDLLQSSSSSSTTNGESDNNNDNTISSNDIMKMQLGLSHSLGRYKLKFSADKVDTMIIQAIGLLDELDKEINTYAMRVKEWYGWHFPELQAIASDNATYAKIVMAGGHRHLLKDIDLSSIYTNSDHDDSAIQIEITAIKEAAEISMGTDITDQDVMNIQSLAEQVISMTEYRYQLYDYLRNRMNAIAPNLTILTGELVGARLIAHAGSLMNLAKQPASTVQILGAEKALFRALKTKHDTPKYGLIYHASLIGQAAPKNKGKISRVLAAKAALAIRVDALSDDVNADGNDEIDTTVGYEGRAKVEARLRQLDGTYTATISKNGTSNLKAQKIAKYDPVVAKIGATNVSYNTASDMVQLVDTNKATTNGGSNDKKEKKAKKEKKRKKEEDDDVVPTEATTTTEAPPSKKKRKDIEENGNDDNDDDEKEKKKLKKAAKKAKKEKRQSE